MEPTRSLHPISAVLRGQGLWAERAQRAIRLHCERGNTQPMIEAVASALLHYGMSRREIPANAGVKTKDLLHRAEEGIRRVVAEYHNRGGVLTAKGYVSELGLVAETAKQWLLGFRSPIGGKNLAEGLDDDAVNARLTVAATRVLKVLHDSSTPCADGASRIVDRDDIEAFCRRAAREMFEAFNAPDAEAHAMLHGEKV
jgi:hypothetical protein